MDKRKPKRKHATNACQACRESKVRCNGAVPSCGSCSKKGKRCQYTVNDDKRRVSLRAAIDVLSGRVIALTRILAENGIPLPQIDPQQERLLADLCETLNIDLQLSSAENVVGNDLITTANTQLATSEHSKNGQSPVDVSAHSIYGSAVQLDTALPLPSILNSTTQSYQVEDASLNWPWHIASSDDFFLSTSLDFNNFNDTGTFAYEDANVKSYDAVQTSGVDAVDRISSEDDQDSDLAKDVSARFGALRVASDGQLRYYGAATNYHLLEGSRHSDLETDIDAISQEVSDRLEQAGLNRKVPTELEEQLIELYFAWHNPSHGNVDRDIFFSTRAHRSTPDINRGYSSDVLVASMCAIGAAYGSRYHPNFVTYPKSLAEYFSSRAKVLLEGDLEYPTIGTIQALCLLSSHEAARGKDARTWLYGGMAMRLCFDLGLHVDCSAYVASGVLSLDEARTRRNTFWSCVVLNNLLSFHFGRPFRIDSEEITVPPIYALSEESRSGTKPYLSSRPSLTYYESRVGDEWVFLCETLVPLIRKLYGSSSTPITLLQEISSNVTRQLETWWEKLPLCFQNDDSENTRPEVLILHMVYHHFQIMLHRPWTSQRLQMCADRGPGAGHAQQVCISSALAISSLLLQYQRFFSLKRMHSYAVNIIFSAALISLFNVISSHKSALDDAAQNRATTSLSIFFQALDDLSQPFESARRARERLAMIQKRWYQLTKSPATMSDRIHA